MAKKNPFAKRLDKTFSKITASDSVEAGFTDINLWVSSGNYAMNRLWSGEFDKSFLFGRNYVLYGESGSGKSLMAAIAAGNAQKEHNAHVAWVDVEHATDDEAGKKWLTKAGVNIDEENGEFKYWRTGTLEGIKKILVYYADMLKDMIKNGEEPTPLVVVVDSWAAAMTGAEADRVYAKKDAGKLVGDMGQKVIQTGNVINAATHLCSGVPMMVIGIQHIMDNQDGYGRKHKTTGGNKMLFYASGCLMLTKKELKGEEIEVGNVEATEAIDNLEKGMSAEALKKKSKFAGITSTMEIIKSRVNKPFEKIEIQIPYTTGLDPYSGLFDLLQQEGTLKVNRPGYYDYNNDKGETITVTKKTFREHADAIMAAASNISVASEMSLVNEAPVVEESSEPEMLDSDPEEALVE